MYKKLSLLLFSFAICSSAFALKAVDAFVGGDKLFFPTIDYMTRLDMVDYFESGSPKASLNSFEEDARVVQLSDDMVTVTQGDILTTSFVILPYGKKQIVMVINTFAANPSDSQIKFYDDNLDELPADKFLKQMKLEDWVGKLSNAERIDMENALPFMTATASYDPATLTLTLTPTVVGMLDEPAKKVVEPKLAKSVTYKWNGKKFTR